MKQKYHPVLRELDLIPLTTKGSSTEPSSIHAVDLLGFFLDNNTLSEKSIRLAVQSIREQRKSNSHEEKQQESKKTDSLTTSSKETMPGGKTYDKPKTHRTRHIALKFLYDGAKYSGLAQNLGQDSDNSVEKALFQALLKAHLVESRETCRYSRCGRTDRGVSAAGQVVALHLKSSIPFDASMDPAGQKPLDENLLPKNENDKIDAWVLPRGRKAKKSDAKKHNSTGDVAVHSAKQTGSIEQEQRIQKTIGEYPYAKILNNLLPTEIRILGWAPVSDEFSARFSATTRTYRYFFTRRRLNLNRIREALTLLTGKHDFRNFCKMDVEKVYNFERVIHDAKLMIITKDENSSGDEVKEVLQSHGATSLNHGDKDLCYVQIHGQAFLWHQIRCIMEVLFMIGNGLEPPAVITELFNIEKYPGKPAYNLAPERPLVLDNCGYPNLQVGYSVQNIWTVSCQLEQQWEDLVLAASRIRNGINTFRDVAVLREDLVSFAKAKIEERHRKRKKMGLLESSVKPDELKLTLTTQESNRATGIVDNHSSIENTIQWRDALRWLEQHSLIPDPNGLNTSIHIPLMKRSMGTTYEEKVEALKKSAKRRQKYEENVIKKRKTAEEDAAFYAHMTSQGGTGM